MVIGASAGGIPVLLELAAALPARFPGAILIVQHIGAHRSYLPELLRDSGSNPAVHPTSGQVLERGTLYVAPPDRHMLLVGNHIRLTHDAKENHVRPAIDPLFRSAAIAHGPRVIGTILSGRLDDGTAGLLAIKACGGLAVVQDPEDAQEPGMPRSALDHVACDRVVTRASLADTLVSLMREPAGMAQEIPPPLLEEHRLSVGEPEPMDDLDNIGVPSKIVCPDCSGVLWSLSGKHPPRYRCHTGHAYSLQSLLHAQAARAEDALWKALRVLEEREYLLRSASQDDEAAHIALHSETLKKMIRAK
ncbi:Chemotaxis response regulator protein-glutamate methylesterase CheB [Lysobacter dokdonensis DS-58]|uniref:protein-glutamate methylesterase n=1 Tax=Lysobacter dokdonensis DS-58 TaxID=1300345 RepID=A0A0A2WM09_9GAMM|nr:Chemotaxis response regulator protein-glutamate methylesterase CheB [Lysobacter dokdonensis DS-58]